MISTCIQRSIRTTFVRRGYSLRVLSKNNAPIVRVVPSMQSRDFSAVARPAPDEISAPGVVIDKPLHAQALDPAVLSRIKAELKDVDVNNDGRLDAEELKQLLRKHTTQFTDEEIVEFGDLYYAGKAGGSVRLETFIEAIDRVATQNAAGTQNASLEDQAGHFKEGTRHPLGVSSDGLEFMTPRGKHGHYTKEELDVKLTHVEPQGTLDKFAFRSVKVVRYLFDSATGWRNAEITVDNILNRAIYLETIAAVPGMVAAIIRHFRSLRSMKADGGYMQLFLEEANNERMHLLTFVHMKDPNLFLRASVIVGQFGFGATFTLAYLLSPKFCHRFVGYVEEEACSTYTKIIETIETAPEGTELASWKTAPPPKIAVAYWKLGEEGTILDMVKAVRADEAEHRDVNHLMSGLKEGQVNPLFDPEAKFDMMLSKYVKDMMRRGD